MRICKYCGEAVASNAQARWCSKNPNLEANRKALSEKNRTVAIRIGTSERIKEAHKKGHYDKAKQKQRQNPTFKGRAHTEEAKQVIREKALASKHRRLKKGTVMYKGVLLDSSWELALAQRLDELNVKWIRPEPIQWQDENGTSHHYFPDFYLPEFDLFIDPKNPAAYTNQIKKIEILRKQIPNLMFLKTLKECQDFIP